MDADDFGKLDHPLYSHPLQKPPSKSSAPNAARSSPTTPHSLHSHHSPQRRPRRPRSPRPALLGSSSLPANKFLLHPPPPAELYSSEHSTPNDPLHAAAAARQTSAEKERQPHFSAQPRPSSASHDSPTKPLTAYATPWASIFNENTGDHGEDGRQSPSHYPTSTVVLGDHSIGHLSPHSIDLLETTDDRAQCKYTIRVRGAGGGDTPAVVQRSLADFTWLEQTLRERYEAVIVPSLPPMALAGRLQFGYAYDFERRRGLEKFLRRVVGHAVLATVDEVRAFIGLLDEETWTTTRKEVSRHQSVIASALFGRRTPEDADVGSFHWISRWGSYKMWQTGRRLNKGIASLLERDSQAQASAVESSAEARLGRLKSYVDELGLSLSLLRRAVERSTDARIEHTRTELAMGEALMVLGEREDGQFGRILNLAAFAPSLSTSLVQAVKPGSGVVLSTASGAVPGHQTSSGVAAGFSQANGALLPSGTASGLSLSSATGTGPSGSKARSTSERAEVLEKDLNHSPSMRWQQKTQTEERLMEVLRDHEQRAEGGKRIMNARLDEQEAYEHASEVYSRLRDKIAARTGSMWEGVDFERGAESARSQGQEELYSSMTEAASTLADAREQYREIALATTDELRRLRNDLHVDLSDSIGAFAKELAQYHSIRAASWDQLASRCEVYTAKSDSIRLKRQTSRSNPE